MAMKVTVSRISYVLGERVEGVESLRTDNPGWPVEDLERKTGVSTRHVVAPGTTAVDLAARACEALLETGITASSIGGLILITQSPDYFLPTSACILQERLGLPTTCAAFDVNLGCSGFVYGLSIAGAMIESAGCDNVLLVCADTYTRYIATDDRSCRPIFSDGAAATLLSRSGRACLGPFVFGTDGSGAGNLIVAEGASRRPGQARIAMDGAKVFMFTMARVPECVERLLERAGTTLEEIDLFIFHQASQVVLDNVARRLGLAPSRMYSNLARVGNLVSASIPVALKDAEDAGVLRDGYRVALVGFGVGYSWAGCVLRWNRSEP